MPPDENTRRTLGSYADDARGIVTEGLGVAEEVASGLIEIVPEAIDSLGRALPRSSSRRRDHEASGADLPPQDALHRLLDLGREAIELAAELPATLLGMASPAGAGAGHEAGDVPVLTMAGPPGTRLDAALLVDTDRSVVSENLELQTTALIGPAKIPKANIHIVGPVTRAHVDAPVMIVSVDVPVQSPKGVYGGLIQSLSWPSVRVVLDVHVR